uniref:Uncharacterized protein n=1 Tax=Octopus bimaculoides TaxID=37653 RepID=A0A0L8HSB9_OCTBM
MSFYLLKEYTHTHTDVSVCCLHKAIKIKSNKVLRIKTEKISTNFNKVLS